MTPRPSFSREHTDWSESKDCEVPARMQPDFAQLRSLPSLDADYRFGRPTLYLAPHELARLTILRSRLGDTRAERQAYAAGTRLQARPEA